MNSIIFTRFFAFAAIFLGLFVSNTYAQDTDGDGIANAADLDDDNDGITDAVENGFCSAGTFTFDSMPTGSSLPPFVLNQSGRSMTVFSRKPAALNTTSTVNNTVFTATTYKDLVISQDPANATQISIFTYRFAQPVRNVLINIQDIDRLTTGATYTDNVRVTAFRSGAAITHNVPAVVVTNNAGFNTVAPAAGNITITGVAVAANNSNNGLVTEVTQKY